MATLTNTKIKDTYDGLLKTTDNDVIGTTEKVITDGLGNASILSIGTQSASFSEDIQINGHTIGKGSGDINSNVVLGTGTLTSNTTGNNNVAIGVNSSLLNTTGVRNISIGTEVLVNNTTGNANIALGFNSLYNLIGSDNIAIGRAAGQYSTGTLDKTAGDQNIYIGANTVSGGQDTDNEIIIGYNTTGNGSNTATYGNSSITDHYFDGNVRADFFYGDGSNLTNLPTGAIPTLQQVTTSGATTTDSITVGGLTAASLIYPSTDGTSGQVISTDGAGNLTFTTVSTSTPSLDQVTAVGATSSVDIEVNGLTVGKGNNSRTNNAALGVNALTAVTTGNQNTAIGSYALEDNTIGINNTAVGYRALLNNTSGGSNIAIGYAAMGASLAGSFNIAIGQGALNDGDCEYSIAIGNGALQNNTSNNNTSIGAGSLSNINGANNVALGYGAGDLVSGGSNKTLGDNNVYIGSNTLSSVADTDNEIVIGANATGNGSNSATYGDSNVTKHIFTGGNVGIGASPSSKLTVFEAGASGIATVDISGGASGAGSLQISAGKVLGTTSFDLIQNSSGAYVYQRDSNPLIFGTANTERMRIDSSGNVGIGVTPSSYNGIASTKVLAVGGAGNNGVNVVSGTTSTGSYMFSDSGGNDRGGLIYYHTADLMTIHTAGSERMRIDSSGNVGINQSNPNDISSGATTLHITGSTTTKAGAIRLDSSDASVVSYIYPDATSGLAIATSTAHNMVFRTSNTERMRITSSGAVFMPYLTGSSGYNDLAYNTANGQLIYRTSSLRYKENVQDLPSALDKVNNLRTVTYDEKETGRSYFGLIAEELYEHIPELVTMKEIEGFDEPQPDGITYSMLSVYLLKAMQEQQEIINDLKARIETLEAK